MNKSVGFYSLRFAIFFVLAVVMVYAIISAMYAFLPAVAEQFLSSGSTGASVVTVIMPPMMVAQTFYKHESRVMTGRESWLLAAIFTALGWVLSAGAVGIILTLQPLNAYEINDLKSLFSDGQSIVMMVIAFFVVFTLMINKLMLWSGCRGEAKKAGRLAAKAARKG